MKKTRGKKKKINLSKKIKNFFIFKNKVSPVAVISLIIVFLAIAGLLIFNHPTGNTISGNDVSNNVGAGLGSGLDNPAPDFVITLTSWLNIGTSWKDIVIGIIVFIIVFVILFDILTLTSIFSGWVSGILAGGLTIVAALTNIIRMATLWMATFAAGLGVLAGFIEIGIAIVVFVGLAIGSPVIARFAARRHANKQVVKSIKKAGDVEGAVAALKGINTELNKR
jgi:hypothetical protein